MPAINRQATIVCFGASPMADECWGFDVDGNNTVDIADYAGDVTEPPAFKGFVDVRSEPIVVPPTP